MNGSREYEQKYESKINNILNNNAKLHGFYSFIGDQSISTVYNYLNHINNFINYTNKEVDALTVDDFSTYMLVKQKNSKGERTTSSYRNTIYAALKQYGFYLVATNVLQRNPMDFISRPKLVETSETINKRAIGYLSKKEIPKYLKTVQNGAGTLRSKNRQKNWKERDLAIVMIFLNTGIRCSALMKLDVNDVNFSNHTLTVTDKESKVTTYDLSNSVMSIIADWLRKREVLLNGNKTEAMFISNRRTRMDQKSIALVVNKYAEQIPDKHITPHKLRATYGTQLYDATKDIYFVQKCMNHSSPKVTETYIRGIQNTTKKASEIMEGLTVK